MPPSLHHGGAIAAISDQGQAWWPRRSELPTVTRMRKPPVFLFAYANDLADDRYLRDLPSERRKVKDALHDAVEAGRCEVVPLPDAEVDEFFNECQRDQHQLSLVHFAGHADGKTLLFQRPNGGMNATNARSIAEFLGTLPALKLVVLNGCSTGEQVDALLGDGVPAVVATSTAVKDHIATKFAARFYLGLAASATIANAFKQASSAVKAELGNHEDEADAIRAAIRDVLPPSSESDAATKWPWSLHGKPEALELSLLPATSVVPATSVSPAEAATPSIVPTPSALLVDASAPGAVPARTLSLRVVMILIASVMVVAYAVYVVLQPPDSSSGPPGATLRFDAGLAADMRRIDARSAGDATVRDGDEIPSPEVAGRDTAALPARLDNHVPTRCAPIGDKARELSEKGAASANRRSGQSLEFFVDAFNALPETLRTQDRVAWVQELQNKFNEGDSENAIRDIRLLWNQILQEVKKNCQP